MRSARELFDRLLPHMSVEEPRGADARTFVDCGRRWALRWRAEGVRMKRAKPRFEEFCEAYGTEVGDA